MVSIEGLYINVEHIDEEFAGSRFGSKNGNLYKCLWPATLEYLGSNSNLYKAQSGNRRIYDLKTNTGTDDYSGLAHFIDVLNNTPVNNLACELEQVFNVDSYLKAMAIDVIIGNWDGPIFNKNNFYLYENPQTGKIEYIPYDLDNTFGIDWFGEDWGTRNIYTWSKSNEPRPIYTQLLSVPEYKDQYTFHLTHILNGFMSNPGYENYIDGIKSMIDPFVPGDQFRTLDYGYSVADFDNSYDNALGGHVKYGIKPYVTTRKNSALNQAIINDIKPIIFEPVFSAPKLNQPTVFSVLVEDESISTVDFHFQFDGGSWQQLSMTDDGNGDDLQAGDNVFTVSIPGFSNGGLLSFYIEATDQNSQTSREPRCMDYELNIAAPAPPLVINELMADNVAYQADEEGEFDDWIEILNVGNEPIPLGDKYLSDDFEEPNKWGMPNITIHPGQYIVFWADADGHQGIRHANFKLKKAGETVGIFNSQANGFSVIDTVTFPALNTDESYGRIPNGTGEFQVLATPTHGSNNEGTSINDPNFSEINIYPNPFSEQIEIAIKPDKYRFLNLEFVDVSGKIVHSEILYSEPTQIHYRINPQNLAKGVYFMIIKDRANDFVVLQTLKMVKI